MTSISSPKDNFTSLYAGPRNEIASYLKFSDMHSLSITHTIFKDILNGFSQPICLKIKAKKELYPDFYYDYRRFMKSETTESKSIPSGSNDSDSEPSDFNEIEFYKKVIPIFNTCIKPKYLEVDDYDIIKLSLESMNHLTGLKVPENFTETQFKLILKYGDKLKFLKMWNSMHNCETLDIKFIDHFPNLTQLKPALKLKESDLDYIFKKLPKLVHMDFSQTAKISENAVLPFIRPQLVSLKLNDNYSISDKLIYELAKNCMSLQELAFSCKVTTVSNQAFKELFGNCRELKTFTIIDVEYLFSEKQVTTELTPEDYLSDDTINVLALNSKKLEELSLPPKLKISNRTITTLSKNCPELNYLSFQWHPELAESIHLIIPRLKEINIGNFKYKEGLRIKKFIKSIKNKCKVEFRDID